jgi:hypothetical protein
MAKLKFRLGIKDFREAASQPVGPLIESHYLKISEYEDQISLRLDKLNRKAIIDVSDVFAAQILLDINTELGHGTGDESLRL